MMHGVDVREDRQSYGEVVGGKIRALRIRTGLDQARLATRMRALGFSWHRQTVGQVEAAQRRITVDEVLGLSLCFGVSIPGVIGPLTGASDVELPSGHVVAYETLSNLVGFGEQHLLMRWNGDEPVMAPVEYARDFARTHDWGEIRENQARLSQTLLLELRPDETVERVVSTLRDMESEGELDPNGIETLRRWETPEGRRDLLRFVQQSLYHPGIVEDQS